MSTYLFLFGAGASYGSEIKDPPPLGQKLFDELQNVDPQGWGQIQNPLAQTFQSNFEQGMEELSRSDKKKLFPLQRTMAKYFFKFTPSQNNLYKKLAQRIKDETSWQGAWATLNYERLSEISLIESGLQPVTDDTFDRSLRDVIATSMPQISSTILNSISDSVDTLQVSQIGNGLKPVNISALQENDIELCFPHGCCHIFCDSVTTPSTTTFPSLVIADGHIKIIDDQREFHTQINNDAFPPVMSYIEPQKTTPVGIAFIGQQRNRFTELVNTASVIGIIGVHINPEDRHIWDPLAQCQAKLVYCAGKISASKFECWRSKNRTHRRDRVLKGYFKDKFENICSELGL